VRVTLRFFDGCPNWHTAQAALREALDATAHEKVDIVLEKVESLEAAQRLGFTGSPTILINGKDPFCTPGSLPGLACRIYNTPEGMRGSPTVEQLAALLR